MCVCALEMERIQPLDVAKQAPPVESGGIGQNKPAVGRSKRGEVHVLVLEQQSFLTSHKREPDVERDDVQEVGPARGNTSATRIMRNRFLVPNPRP
jgi:hypothetical protein